MSQLIHEPHTNSVRQPSSYNEEVFRGESVVTIYESMSSSCHIIFQDDVSRLYACLRFKSALKLCYVGFVKSSLTKNM